MPRAVRHAGDAQLAFVPAVHQAHLGDRGVEPMPRPVFDTAHNPPFLFQRPASRRLKMYLTYRYKHRNIESYPAPPAMTNRSNLNFRKVRTMPVDPLSILC